MCGGRVSGVFTHGASSTGVWRASKQVHIYDTLITLIHTLPHFLQVWDLRRLERDVAFRSRLTYAAQQGRITAVAAVSGGGGGWKCGGSMEEQWCA